MADSRRTGHEPASPDPARAAGMDGFYDRRNCESSYGNPSGWAGYTGQDFMPQHAVRAIDYAGMHLWPDNWKRQDLDFGRVDAQPQQRRGSAGQAARPGGVWQGARRPARRALPAAGASDMALSWHACMSANRGLAWRGALLSVASSLPKGCRQVW